MRLDSSSIPFSANPLIGASVNWFVLPSPPIGSQAFYIAPPVCQLLAQLSLSILLRVAEGLSILLRVAHGTDCDSPQRYQAQSLLKSEWCMLLDS